MRNLQHDYPRKSSIIRQLTRSDSILLIIEFVPTMVSKFSFFWNLLKIFNSLGWLGLVFISFRVLLSLMLFLVVNYCQECSLRLLLFDCIIISFYVNVICLLMLAIWFFSSFIIIASCSIKLDSSSNLLIF